MPLSFLLRRWAELQSTADADKHVQAIAALKGENIRYKTFATIPGGSSAWMRNAGKPATPASLYYLYVKKADLEKARDALRDFQSQ